MNKIILIIFFILINGCDVLHEKQSLIHGINNFPNGLDPGKNFDVHEIQIYSQVYETLVKLEEDGHKVIPCLAKKWKVSEDGKLFTFYLQPNVYFHDNSLLNAEIVKYSFDRQLELNGSSPLLNMIDTVEVTDSSSFSIRLKYPYALFLYNLTSPTTYVAISKNALKKYGNDIAFHPIGTGPFYLKKWEPKKTISLNTFKNYWKSKNNINKIIFEYYDNLVQREKSLQQDEVDVLNTISGYSIDRLKWLGTIDYKVFNPINVIYLGFNNNDELLKNIFIRKAILRSINIPKLVLNLLRGNSLVSKGPLPPSLHNYNEIKQEIYNIRESKKMLKQAGYDKGLRLKFYFPKHAITRQTIIELLKSNLSKIGISLDVKMFNSWEDFNEACRSDSSQLFISGWASDVVGDPENFLYSLFYSKSEFNSFNYKNIQVDLWLDQARREFDRNKREILYKKIVEQILEDTPAVFLYHVKEHFAYNTNKIKSLPVDPYGIIQYHKVELNEN